MLTAVMTETGPAYVDLAHVVVISSPFGKPGRPELRSLGMAGGHKVYVLNDEGNRTKLAGLLPADAPVMAQAAPPTVVKLKRCIRCNTSYAEDGSIACKCGARASTRDGRSPLAELIGPELATAKPERKRRTRKADKHG